MPDHVCPRTQPSLSRVGQRRWRDTIGAIWRRGSHSRHPKPAAPQMAAEDRGEALSTTGRAAAMHAVTGGQPVTGQPAAQLVSIKQFTGRLERGVMLAILHAFAQAVTLSVGGANQRHQVLGPRRWPVGTGRGSREPAQRRRSGGRRANVARPES